MSENKSSRQNTRKAARKTLHYNAWIDLADGSPPLDCMLADVSESGAKLKLSASTKIPDSFKLLLTRDGHSSRQCQVVRRESLDVGIKFTGRLKTEKLAL